MVFVHFSSLLINVLCDIFLSGRAISSMLKTCSCRYLSSSMMSLMVSVNSSATSWSAEAASPITLTFLIRYVFLMTTLHTHKGCIFNTRQKDIFQKAQGFCVCCHRCSEGSTYFLSVVYNGHYSGFIFLEMVGNHSCYSCRPQSTVHFKQSNIFLQCCVFFCFLGALSTFLVAVHMDSVLLVKVYAIALNTMKNTRELKEISSYFHTQLTGETNSSLRLTTVATGGGYVIITVLQYVLQLILCNYDLILPFNTCLHFLDCKWHKVEFVSVWKSDKF